MKKYLSLLSLALAGTLFVGCGGGGKDSTTSRDHNTATTLVDYDAQADKSMDVYAYYPDDTESGMQLAKELGITHFLLTRDREYITTAPDKVQKTIALAGKYGIKSFPFTGHLSIDSDVGFSAEWLHDENVAGIYYYDEPYYDTVFTLGNRVEYFNRNFQDKTYLVALGSAGMVVHPTWHSDANYEEFVYTYCMEVLDRLDEGMQKVLMADCYPIKIEKSEYSISTHHLYTLMELAAQAKEFGAETNLAVQTLEHTVGNGATHFPAPTVEMMRFQIYPLLSFGFKGFTYYTYETRPTNAGSGEVNLMGLVKDGQKTEIYDVVKQVTDEVLSYDHVYLSFEWDGVIPLTPTNEQRSIFGQVKDFGRYVLTAEDTKVLKALDSDNNILCGVMRDEAGNEGYSLSNYTAPWDGNTALVNMTFDDCNKAIVYHNGEKSVATLKNGVLELELAPCDGAFVIPYKD